MTGHIERVIFTEIPRGWDSSRDTKVRDESERQTKTHKQK